MSVLSHPSPALPTCFSWFISCQVWAENKMPHQNPGPQSLCNLVQQTLCRHRRPPKPQLSCCSLMRPAVTHFGMVPTSTPLPPPHSRASLLSISAHASSLPSLGTMSPSRCYPTTETCGRKDTGLCCLCQWGAGVNLSVHPWERGEVTWLKRTMAQ